MASNSSSEIGPERRARTSAAVSCAEMVPAQKNGGQQAPCSAQSSGTRIAVAQTLQ